MYSFDTSALIDGLERFYPPANFAALWIRIDDLATEGRLLISDEVLLEAKNIDAPLKEWCKTRQHLGVATDPAIAATVGGIVTDFPNWTIAGKNGADPFVIAVAEKHGAVVVTGEKPGGPGKPKIPYVCKQRGLECINFTNVIIREGWTFS